MFHSTEAHVARRSVVCVTMAVAGRRKGRLQRWIASNLQTSTTFNCLFLAGSGLRVPAELFPPQQNGSCETFVMPLWVSKCPGGSKCQRHTRRLRLGRKPNSVPCAMLKSMGYEMCQGSYVIMMNSQNLSGKVSPSILDRCEVVRLNDSSQNGNYQSMYRFKTVREIFVWQFWVVFSG